MMMARRDGPMPREDFLRCVQAAKRAADLSAPLRFAAYLDALEAFTTDSADAPGSFRMTPADSRAAARLHTAATARFGGDRPTHLRELAQSIADRHGLRLADVLRLDVAAAADLSA